MDCMVQWDNRAILIEGQQVQAGWGTTEIFPKSKFPECLFQFLQIHDIRRHSSRVPWPRIKAFVCRPQCCFPRLRPALVSID